MKLYCKKIKTPWTTLFAYADANHLIGIFFDQKFSLPEYSNQKIQISKDQSLVLDALQSQMDEYFQGQRKDFDIPLKLKGSEFQIAVWKQIRKIPFGKTLSYGEQAKKIGRASAVRAVASANGHNRFPILIPCHRVLRSDGSIGGYSGGVGLKVKLLEFESKTI
jgi:methylated-DNA-[protein]-cysteine S-methyltransferase